MAAVTITSGTTVAGPTAGVECTGPGVLYLSGIFDGAAAIAELSRLDESSGYKPLFAKYFYKGGHVKVDEVGTYYLRIDVLRPGDNTIIKAYLNQA